MKVTPTYRQHGSILAEQGAPLIRVDRSAYLPCGCTVHVGHEWDGGRPAVALVPHAVDAHRALIERARGNLRALGADAHDIEHAAGALERAARR